MELPFGTPQVVVNGRAGRHASAVADTLAELFHAQSVPVSVLHTSTANDLTSACTSAAENGCGFVIVVGGDGSVRDAVNGLMASGNDATQRPVLGIVGAGTGSDFSRTYGLDRDVHTLFPHFLTDNVALVDVGHVHAQPARNGMTDTYFLNVAQAGFGAHVTRQASRLPKRLGANRYRLAVPSSLTRFRHVPMRVTLDSTVVTDELLNVIVANGQFYGAGLHVAPQALPHDGVFDVQCWQVAPQELAAAHAQLKTGDHLARDGVRQWRSATVTVSAPRPIVVEADGDVVGVTPATFTITPHALRLKT